MDIDRPNTLWTKGQLTEDPTEAQIASCRGWMNDNLPDKDLLIVGFWTDWGYLNEVLEGLLNGQNPGSVTVIDSCTTDQLSEKAPGLWAIVEGLPNFTHIQMSSDEALSELRTEFSKVWMKRMLAKGSALYEETVGACPAGHLECPDLSADDLYDIRRDAEGTSYMHAARSRSPSDETGRVALLRMILTDAGAVVDGPWLRLNDRTIRVLNGNSRSLRKMQDSYNEPAAIGTPDMTICAGAVDRVLPGNFVRGGGEKRVTRQARGGVSQWMTDEQAKEALGL
jgi:hypothetical protein